MNAHNPLLQLRELGQSVWLDDLSRSLVQGGELARLVREDGLAGVTSNPAIFHKAITAADVYREPIRELARAGRSAREIYETLAIEDVQAAAATLLPIFAATSGGDGYVSLEVSPRLARDTAGTIQEARRLYRAVNRPNLFIKIPATPEGIPAIEACLAEGIPINITLLFSIGAYLQVMDAYLKALEIRLEEGQPITDVTSVASFFLSRIDVLVDARLDAMVRAGQHADEARALRGRAAVANAKLAYQEWKQIFRGPRWERLRQAGAQVQRPLWASTSTKDPTYHDVRYVEPLIGPQTVSTMPEETLAAFRDHGQAALTVERGVDEAGEVMRRLAAIGIDMTEVTDRLLAEGLEKFCKPEDALLKAVEEQRRAAVERR